MFSRLFQVIEKIFKTLLHWLSYLSINTNIGITKIGLSLKPRDNYEYKPKHKIFAKKTEKISQRLIDIECENELKKRMRKITLDIKEKSKHKTILLYSKKSGKLDFIKALCGEFQIPFIEPALATPLGIHDSFVLARTTKKCILHILYTSDTLLDQIKLELQKNNVSILICIESTFHMDIGDEQIEFK